MYISITDTDKLKSQSKADILEKLSPRSVISLSIPRDFDEPIASPRLALSSMSCAFKHQKPISKTSYKIIISQEIKQQMALVKASSELIRNLKFLIGKKRIDCNSSKTIVLDLCGTLCMNIAIKQDIHRLSAAGCSTSAIIPLQGKYSNEGIIKRPNLDLFIKMLSPHYNIMVYTTEEQEKAIEVIGKLGISKFIKSPIFSRKDCCSIGSNLYAKDAYTMTQNYCNTIIVSNSLLSFCTYPSNGIFISTFKGDSKDSELLKLGQFLIGIYEREIITTALKDTCDLSPLFEQSLSYN